MGSTEKVSIPSRPYCTGKDIAKAHGLDPIGLLWKRGDNQVLVGEGIFVPQAGMMSVRS